MHVATFKCTMYITSMAQDQTTPPPNAVFMLSQAAKILGLLNSQVKNWTIGRPLSINPSITAHGTGSRNMYDPNDLCRLAVAAQLSACGLTARAIQEILDELRTNFLDVGFVIVSTAGSGHVPWKKTKLHVRVIPDIANESESWRLIRGSIHNSPGCYVLNVRLIIEAVNQLTREFLRGPMESERSQTRAAGRASRGVKTAPATKAVGVDFLTNKRKIKFEEME
jgi:DNA-binding transcriptional MerR regulator